MCYYEVIQEFNRLTNIPIILNTSFNGPGEPIVESPKDAIEFFLKSDLDALYLEGIKIIKTRTSTLNQQEETEELKEIKC
jgi:carbamoyltransferase